MLVLFPLNYEKEEGADAVRATYAEAEIVRVTMHDHPQIQALEKYRWSQKTNVGALPLIFKRTSAIHNCYGTSLKIYVYDVPKELVPDTTLYCSFGQWATDLLFHKWFELGTCRTFDPNEADFFLAPIYNTFCRIAQEQTVKGPGEDIQTQESYTPLWKWLREQQTFHRNGQLDHIFLFSDGRGPLSYAYVDLIRSDALLFTVESKCPTWDMLINQWVDIHTCTSRWKDFVHPGHTDFGRMRGLRNANMKTNQRHTLLTWRGRSGDLHSNYKTCGVRDKIMAMKDYKFMDIGDFVDDYFERKGLSHFCLVPGGKTPWTNQLYESFFAGCIPVIVSDEFQVAYEHLPWEEFSIKWPEKYVGDELYNYLLLLLYQDIGKVKQMKAAVDKHACWFDWYSTDPNCSPFLAAIQHLEKRKKEMPPFRRFWNHPSWTEDDGFVHLDRPTVYQSPHISKMENISDWYPWLSRNFVHHYEARIQRDLKRKEEAMEKQKKKDEMMQKKKKMESPS